MTSVRRLGSNGLTSQPVAPAARDEVYENLTPGPSEDAGDAKDPIAVDEISDWFTRQRVQA